MTEGRRATVANRCLNIIEELEREAEKNRRLDRLQASSDVYCAAMAEAIEHGVTLSHHETCYMISDNRHVLTFYPATNHAMRRLYGESRSRSIEPNTVVPRPRNPMSSCE